MEKIKLFLIGLVALVMLSLAVPALADNWTLQGSNIYNNNSGYVGIGTSTPTATLHVYGDSGYSVIRVESGPDASFPLFQLMDDRVGGYNWNIEDGRDTLGTLGFRSNFPTAGIRMVITKEGRVGIGTTTPSQTLDVNGSINLAGSIVSPGDICIGTCP